MKSHADYSRYFALKQRAYLINISEERDREHFESLSGVIIDRSGNTIVLQIPYPTEQELPGHDGIPGLPINLPANRWVAGYR